MVFIFFILLLFILPIILLAYNGDKWFPPKYHTTYICNYDGEIVDTFEDHSRPTRQHTRPKNYYDEYDDDIWDGDLFDDDDDDDCNSIVYIDDDEFDTFNSYAEEPDPQPAPEEPMLYGGLPYGDGFIYFEDDGDAFL